MTIEEIRYEILKLQCTCAWEAGVRNYARDLLDYSDFPDQDYMFTGDAEDRKRLLHGAKDWYEYSWGGCALEYDREIVLRLYDSEQIQKYKYGDIKPSVAETWKDIQARALAYAEALILLIAGKHDSPARKGCADNG